MSTCLSGRALMEHDAPELERAGRSRHAASPEDNDAPEPAPRRAGGPPGYRSAEGAPPGMAPRAAPRGALRSEVVAPRRAMAVQGRVPIDARLGAPPGAAARAERGGERARPAAALDYPPAGEGGRLAGRLDYGARGAGAGSDGRFMGAAPRAATREHGWGADAERDGRAWSAVEPRRPAGFEAAPRGPAERGPLAGGRLAERLAFPDGGMRGAGPGGDGRGVRERDTWCARPCAYHATHYDL